MFKAKQNRHKILKEIKIIIYTLFRITSRKSHFKNLHYPSLLLTAQEWKSYKRTDNFFHQSMCFCRDFHRIFSFTIPQSTDHVNDVSKLCNSRINFDNYSLEPSRRICPFQKNTFQLCLMVQCYFKNPPNTNNLSLQTTNL